jgi:hypothetical protein
MRLIVVQFLHKLIDYSLVELLGNKLKRFYIEVWEGWLELWVE